MPTLNRFTPASAALLTLLLAGCTADSSKFNWRTRAERTGYQETARYDETVQYCLNLERCCRWVRVYSIGRTPQGRQMALVVVSRERAFTPEEAAKTGKSVVLITNGIHSGEIEGKDASLALLREVCIDKTRANLLDHAIVLVVPVFNIDGHERVSPYNRISQNGPREMGWRCTAQNLNLNRDFAKADAPEMRAWLAMYHAWRPHLWFDTHTTDGADYQYDITFVSNDGPETAPPVGEWIRTKLYPHLMRTLPLDGHHPQIFFDLHDRLDPSKGIGGGGFAPRFSTGYGAITNRPSILVETHMLKLYDVRVKATHSLLAHTLELVNSDGESLREAVRKADEAATALGQPAGPRGSVVLSTTQPADDPGEPITFATYAVSTRMSEASGAAYPVWDHSKPIEVPTRLYARARPLATVQAPLAYLIPAACEGVIQRLIQHGQLVERLTAPCTIEVESYRFSDVDWTARPFEGRHVVSYKTTPIREARTFAAGAALVRLDHPMSRVAVHLLEPEGPDALVRWGLFDPIFEQKEYFEDYAMAPIADRMLAESPALREEFTRWLADHPDQAKNPRARLEFFYRRSPYWDARKDIYPVGRVIDAAALRSIPVRR